MTKDEILGLIKETLLSFSKSENKETETVDDDQNTAAMDSSEGSAVSDLSKEDIVKLVTETVQETMKNNSPNVGAPQNTGNVLDIDSISKMSKEEINSRWNEVQKVLESQSK